MRRGKIYIFAVLVCVTFLTVACASKKPRPEPQNVQHRVEYRGETLGLIARWYTGAPSNWKGIVVANPGLKPNRIKIGQIIQIPGPIVTNRDPLPKSAVKFRTVNKEIVSNDGGSMEDSDLDRSADKLITDLTESDPSMNKKTATLPKRDQQREDLMKELTQE